MTDSILRALVAQKQLAKFRIVKIFLGLELPRSRQTFVQNGTSNLARGPELAIRSMASC
jgi:hypothetical protein